VQKTAELIKICESLWSNLLDEGTCPWAATILRLHLNLFSPLLDLIMSANSSMQMTRNFSWPCLLLTTVKVLMYFNLA